MEGMQYILQEVIYKAGDTINVAFWKLWKPLNFSSVSAMVGFMLKAQPLHYMEVVLMVPHNER